MAELLFCPFCREPFEGARECPEHELQLVPWLQLPQTADSAERSRVAPWSVLHGRGWVLLGALSMLVGFFLPLAIVEEEVRRASSLWQLAHGHALRLWLVPTTVMALGLVLYRRRSLASMRGARVAVPLLALVPAIAVAVTLRGALSAAELIALKTRMAVNVQVGAGSWLVAFGCVCVMYGGSRLGTAPVARVR